MVYHQHSYTSSRLRSRGPVSLIVTLLLLTLLALTTPPDSTLVVHGLRKGKGSKTTGKRSRGKGNKQKGKRHVSTGAENPCAGKTFSGASSMAASFTKAENHVASQRCWEYALVLRPDSVDAALGSARALGQRQKHRKGYDLLRHFLAKYKGDDNLAEVHHEVAMLSLDVGELNAGLRHLNIAVKLDPDSSVYLSSLGSMYNILGQSDKAHPILKRAYEKDKTLTTGFNYAQSLRALGKIKEADAIMKEASHRDSDGYNKLVKDVEKAQEEQREKQGLEVEENVSTTHDEFASLKNFLSDADEAYLRTLRVSACHDVKVDVRTQTLHGDQFLEYSDRFHRWGACLHKVHEYRGASLAWTKGLSILPEVMVYLDDDGAEVGTIESYQHTTTTGKRLAYYSDIVRAYVRLLDTEDEIPEVLPFLKAIVRVMPALPPVPNPFPYELDHDKLSSRLAHLILRARVLDKGEESERALTAGNDYFKAGVYKLARVMYEHCVYLDPDNPEAHSHLAKIMMNLRSYESSAFHFRQVLRLKPERDTDILRHLVHTQSQLARWENEDENLKRLIEMCDVEYDKMQSQKPFTDQGAPLPWQAMQMFLPARQIIRMTELHAKYLASTTTNRLQLPYPTIPHPPGRLEPLRVAFYSADFRDHPAGYFTQHIFSLHDRTRVQLIGFAQLPPEGRTGQRFLKGASKMVSLEGLSDRDRILRMREEQVHVVIDTTGWTFGGRPELLGERVAPVQAVTMGYTGTVGVSEYDYYLGDRFVAPPVFTHKYWHEKIAYMPHSYMMNHYPEDHQEVLQPEHQGPIDKRERAKYGLPVNAIVFANFSRMFKIDRVIFDAWMRILRRLPEAVLWLLEYEADSKVYIHSECISRGIDPRRVIFSRRFPRDRHLIIKRLADVYLDTPKYNSHTTGMDNLWSGVPMITLPREHMATRVGSSLLHAVNVPELVATSVDHYIDLAVTMATNSTFRNEARDKIERGRSPTSPAPLWDLKRWVRDFEDNVQAMYDVFHLTGRRMHIVPSREKATGPLSPP